MSDSGSISPEVMEVLQKACTGMIADALAMSGIRGAIQGVRPARGFEDAKVIGLASTVLFAPARPGAPRLNNFLAIRAAEPGTVLVIDGKGYDGHFTGDNQGALAKKLGLAGIVVYGGARDLAGYREMGMPLYCTGSAVADKPAELALAAHGVPVEVGGTLVKPGDIVVADEDGVVCIPAEAIGTFMENMKTIFDVEASMERAIEGDASNEELTAIISRKKPKK